MTASNSQRYRYLGRPRKLVEGAEKVLGSVRYAGDVVVPGMVYARPVLSPYAHAAIRGIETATAAAYPGVIAVLTAVDLPTRDKLMESRNSAVLARDRVRWRGQPVAVVVAATPQAAADAAEAVTVDYDPLTAVVGLTAAIQADAPPVWPTGLPSETSELSSIHANVEESAAEADDATLPPNVFDHKHYERGDLAAGWAEAAVRVEHTYDIPMVHQGYLEPHACVAVPDPLGSGLTLYTGTQGSYQVRDEVAGLLSLPVSAVRVVPMTLGGGFGAKYGIVEPLAGAVALALGRPVQLQLTRSQDFLATTPSQGMRVHLKTGATADGRLCALEAAVYLDNGVYAFTMGSIAAALLGGYYRCDHVAIDVYEVVTNTLPTGAYRAPSAPQVTFALESNIDMVARQLAIDPLTFRQRNGVVTGDPMGNNKAWPEIGLDKVLETLAHHPRWREQEKGPNEGIGIAVGGWPAFMGPASAICRVETDGTVIIQSGAVDISGVNSAFVLVAAEVLGVSPDAVSVVSGDTQMGPHAPPSGGSQVTYSVAGAIAAAAEKAREKLTAVAADEFEASEADIELIDGQARVRGVPDRAIPIGRLAKIARDKAGGGGPIIGQGSDAVPHNAPGFVVHLVKVRVDPDTGEVTPLYYLAIQDVGFALNPLMVQGQMQGGAIQGLGMGLYEALVYDDQGQLLSGTFMDYALPRSDNVPTIETVLVEHPSPHGPFGARGIGEPPIVAGAAAVANAVYDATGVRVTRLPIRAEDVWRGKEQLANGKG